VNAVSRAAANGWCRPVAGQGCRADRGLPKSLRRNFVPARFRAQRSSRLKRRASRRCQALAGYLQRITGVAIDARDFADISVPLHLLMRFRVYDERGMTLAEGRDIESIREQWGDSARAAFSRRADTELTREDVNEFDIDIPEAVVGEGGLTAYPALVDLGDAVALRVFERSTKQIRASRRRRATPAPRAA